MRRIRSSRKLRSSRYISRGLKGFPEGFEVDLRFAIGEEKRVMEKNNYNHPHNNRERLGVLGGGGGDHGLLRSITHPPETRSSATAAATTTSSDFVLQWGNRKRLRCMKMQAKDRNADSASAAVHRTTVRVDRRVVRSDTNNDAASHQPLSTTTAINGNGYLNLRQRSSSPSHRILSKYQGLSQNNPPCLRKTTRRLFTDHDRPQDRNSDSSIAMKCHSNGVRGLSSPDRGVAQDKRGSAHHNTTTNHHLINPSAANNDNNGGGGGSGSSETAHDSKKGGGGTSSGGSDAIPAVWPPKFVIALTNKEKEEDFIAFKGSKLPQRPKKRAKFIQRTLNLVSPGAWLCDLTLERYEVREKKITKKQRPRGLKAMGNMESDSE
ncbi:unnamed protein product [Camellia sinensis]